MKHATASEEPETETSAVERFALRHQARAEGKRRSHTRPDKREYRLVTVPERVMNIARTLTMDYPFSRLVIDDSYQRLELKNWVNDLADLRRRGGSVPPIDVVHREWETGDKLYIVDGQQRYWASWDAQKPLVVQVHNCRTLQEEKDYFDLLNDRRRLAPNYVIHNHAGPARDILVDANEDPSHPWFNRIHFKGGAPGGRVAAGSLISAMARLVGGSHGGTLSQLTAVDKACASGNKMHLVEFVRLVATVYAPPLRVNADNLFAFARALSETKTKLPLSRPTVTRLRHLKLDTVKANTKAERQLLMTRRIVKALGVTNPFALDTL